MNQKFSILIVDDEAIVRDSIAYIIEENFNQNIKIKFAKNGRQAIELAESFKPDIAFFDIQMPGINGITAMEKIKSFLPELVLIVVSAYDHFQYAQKSIQLGAIDYINKPIQKDKIIDLLNQAFQTITKKRNRKQADLEREEMVNEMLPLVESSFMQTLLFDNSLTKTDFSEFLNIIKNSKEQGFVMILSNRLDKNIDLQDEIGYGIQVNQYLSQISFLVKGHFNAVLSPPIGMRIVIFVFCDPDLDEYKHRLEVIHKANKLLTDIEQHCKLKVRIGIGTIEALNMAKSSYKEATHALGFSSDSIAHVNDLPLSCQMEPNYPLNTEKIILESVRLGQIKDAVYHADSFLSWMIKNYPNAMDNIRLKCLEFVLYAEYIAYSSGGMSYQFMSRKDYLSTVTSFADYPTMKKWFCSKIEQAASNVAEKKFEKTTDQVLHAKTIIENRYQENLSLESVSKELGMSPYYFGKLFKNKADISFNEYLTDIRLKKAKACLFDKNLSIKEISYMVGFSDPNYFSRLFKKMEGCSPSEYRETLV